MNLSIEQVARGLDLPMRTIKRWVRQGRIPADRSGQGYTFDLAVIQKWAAARKLPFAFEPQPPAEPADESTERLLTAMQIGKAYYGIQGSRVEEVLHAAVRRIAFLDDESKGTLYKNLVQRESLMSTGVGRGIAIPHPRTPITFEPPRAFISTCFLSRPVDFKAVDDQPVSLMFILCCPTVKTHLNLLSKLSFCLRDDGFGHFLMSRPDAETLFERVAEMEQSMEQG